MVKTRNKRMSEDVGSEGSQGDDGEVTCPTCNEPVLMSNTRPTNFKAAAASSRRCMLCLSSEKWSRINYASTDGRMWKDLDAGERRAIVVANKYGGHGRGKARSIHQMA